MRYYTENEFRQEIDDPARKMLELWHKECRNRFQTDLEVKIADRHQNFRFQDIEETFSTALPEKIENKLTLVLWLESVEPLNNVLITHELGHFVLNLRGFKFLVNSLEPSGDVGGMLNSFASHPPLFVLQRSTGHNPQPMIDLKMKDDIEVYESPNKLQPQFFIRDGLLVADDLNNCSLDEKQRLTKIVQDRYPNIYKVANTALDTIRYYDLNDPKQNLRFIKNLRKVLNLGSSWIEYDYADKMSHQIKDKKISP